MIKLDWISFWVTNKKYIDPVATQYKAIPRHNAVTATINGVDETSSVDKPKHEEITPMNLGNTIITNISTDQSGIVLGLKLRLHLEGDLKKTKKKSGKEGHMAGKGNNQYDSCRSSRLRLLDH